MNSLKGHMPALDGVRGLAVLIVMAYHFRAPDLPRWVMAGSGIWWCGVDLFFVLSGFLITGILLDSREAPRCLPVFWARRVLRIFPLYFVALALLLAVAPSGWLPASQDQRFYWLYLNNWLNFLAVRDANHILGHFWSLAVEEQFYLFWPLVVWALPPRWTLRAACLGILMAVAARCLAVAGGAGPELVYRHTLLRLDALLAGAACACLARTADPKWLCLVTRRSMLAAAAGLALLLLAAQSTHYQNQWIQLIGYPLLWLACAGFVLDCALRPGDWRWLCAKPLRRMGQYSYGLYVWHWPVAFLMLEACRQWRLEGWGVAAAIQATGFVLSAAVAWTSYRFLEEPMLRLKRYFVVEKDGRQPEARLFFNSSISAGTTSNRSPTIP